MSTSPPGPAVNVQGASCRLGPSPTALAVRLQGLRVTAESGLDALLAALPEPPWDAELAVDDPAVGMLTRRGFTPYLRSVLLARAADGLPGGSLPGVEFVEYRNDWAQAFTQAEAQAMTGLAAFEELGSPSGYEWGQGQGAFWIARDPRGLVLGFAHADLPDGVVDWLGVVPQARRTGVGTGLVAALGRHVRAQRGTHLMAAVQEGTDGVAFLRALGFTERGRRVALIRRD